MKLKNKKNFCKMKGIYIENLNFFDGFGRESRVWEITGKIFLS